jgi:putative endonuclease
MTGGLDMTGLYHWSERRVRFLLTAIVSDRVYVLSQKQVVKSRSLRGGFASSIRQGETDEAIHSLPEEVMPKTGYVYILTNWNHSVLYAGVTSDLRGRLFQHRAGVTGGFAKRYHANILVYYQAFGDIQYAIAEEKRIKGGSRAGKIKLIEEANPEWKDLSGEI